MDNTNRIPNGNVTESFLKKHTSYPSLSLPISLLEYIFLNSSKSKETGAEFARYSESRDPLGVLLSRQG